MKSSQKARNAYAAYLHWESINRITFRHTEVSLASEKHAFGGTLDAVGMIGNALVLLDWKCANAVYADYLYQLAAYGLLWNENYPDHPLGRRLPSMPLRQRAGRFLPPLFPVTRRRGRNVPADARAVRSREEGRAARALTEDNVTITQTAETTGAAKPAVNKGQLGGAQAAAAALPRGRGRTVRHRPRRLEGAGRGDLPKRRNGRRHRHGPVLLPRPQSRPVQTTGPHRADVVERGRQDDRDGVAGHLRAAHHRIPDRPIRRDERAGVRPSARNDTSPAPAGRGRNKGQERIRHAANFRSGAGSRSRGS